jgi:hypothetical protein
MPYLIDANNLMHALADVGYAVERAGLCELLTAALGTRDRIDVVFDGPEQTPEHTGHMLSLGVAVHYGPGGTADDVIEGLISENTAPRRLTVVSTDRRIRSAARRRRCTSCTSEDFAGLLRRRLETPPPPQPSEPREKRKGLNPDQAEHWMREFGFDPDNPAADDEFPS